jgi:hypothetical protein
VQQRKTSDRGGISSMGQAVKSFLAESGLGSKLRDLPVYEAWQEALGEELSRRARPVDFRRSELIVEVESAAHMHELANFTGERYRQLANRNLGSERISKVTFKLKR